MDIVLFFVLGLFIGYKLKKCHTATIPLGDLPVEVPDPWPAE